MLQPKDARNEAFIEERFRIPERRRQVLRAIEARPGSCYHEVTELMCAIGLKIEKTSVDARIFELREASLIEVDRVYKCGSTNKNINHYRITPTGDQCLRAWRICTGALV